LQIEIKEFLITGSLCHLHAHHFAGHPSSPPPPSLLPLQLHFTKFKFKHAGRAYINPTASQFISRSSLLNPCLPCHPHHHSHKPAISKQNYIHPPFNHGSDLHQTPNPCSPFTIPQSQTCTQSINHQQNQIPNQGRASFTVPINPKIINPSRSPQPIQNPNLSTTTVTITLSSPYLNSQNQHLCSLPPILAQPIPKPQSPAAITEPPALPQPTFTDATVHPSSNPATVLNDAAPPSLLP
jgi:hypothetical protein